VLERERDSVAHAEAHAEVGRSKDAHTSVSSSPRRAVASALGGRIALRPLPCLHGNVSVG
jgi:hypothetical protein